MSLVSHHTKDTCRRSASDASRRGAVPGSPVVLSPHWLPWIQLPVNSFFLRVAERTEPRTQTGNPAARDSRRVNDVVRNLGAWVPEQRLSRAGMSQSSCWT